jgi:hypothetical protein
MERTVIYRPFSLGSKTSRSVSPRKVKPERRDDDRQAAGDGDPRRLADIGEAVVQDRAPGRRGRADAEAEETHPGLDGDDDGYVHGGEDHQRPDDVGQDMQPQDPRRARPHALRRGDEFGGFERNGLGPDDPRVARDVHEDHHDHDGGKRRPRQCHQRQRQHDGRKALQRVEEQDHHVVEPARPVARDQPQDDPQRQRDRRRDQRHVKRDAPAMEHPAEEVAAQLVGAQQVRRRGVEEPVARAERRRFILREKRREGGTQNDHDDQHDAEGAQRLAQDLADLRPDPGRRGGRGGVRNCFGHGDPALR